MDTGLNSLSSGGGWRLPGANEWLEYRREAVIAGQVWRFLSAHWTHISPDHLSWDLLVFLVLGAACERRCRPRLLVTVLGSAILAATAVWFLIPGMSAYRGLSGIGSALLTLLVVQLIRDAVIRGTPRDALFPGALLFLFIWKIGYEH